MKALITVDGEVFLNSLPNFTRNDYGFKLFFQIKDNNDIDIDITGFNITFKMRLITSAVSKVSALCTITTPLEGKCEYQFITTDLDTIGVYDVELQIENPGTSIETIPLGRVTVLEDLP